jgi:hypothetical protein
MVVILFSMMARSALRQIRVGRKDELADRIQRVIERRYDAPLAPNWSYGDSRNPQPVGASAKLQSSLIRRHCSSFAHFGVKKAGSAAPKLCGE